MKKILAGLLFVCLCALPVKAQDYARGTVQSSLGLNGAAVVVKPAIGMLVTVTVTTAGSTTGSANDAATTGAVAAGNLIATIPNTVGVYYIPFPFLNGLVITPGTSQVISVAFQ
jgi:hypothetical protein